MSLGEQLRNAREEKGLTLEDVARATFIRAHYIEAIERDDFSDIPPSRLKYFVHDIARNVGLDPAALADVVPERKPTPSVPRQPGPGNEPKRNDDRDAASEPEEGPDAPRTVFVAPAPEMPETGSGREADGLRRRRPRYAPIDQGNPSLVRGLMTAALVLLVGLGIYYLVGGFDEDSYDVASSSDTADSSAASSDVRIISRPDDTTSAVPGETGSGDSLVLEGHAAARVWYSIRMDSRQETGTLDSGEVKVWKAAQQFSVSLGNAGGLSFALNGKPLGTLGPIGTTFRGKVITAEGVKTSSVPRRPAARTQRSKPDGSSADDPASRMRRLEETEPRPAVDPN